MPCSSKWWLFLFVGIVQGRCPMKKQVFQGVDSIKIFIQQEKRWRKWPDDFRQAKRDHPPQKEVTKAQPNQKSNLHPNQAPNTPLGIVQGLIAAVGTYWPQLSTLPIPRDARFFDWNPSTFHPKTRNRYLDPPKKYDPCEAAFDWRHKFFRFSLHDLKCPIPRFQGMDIYVESACPSLIPGTSWEKE